MLDTSTVILLGRIGDPAALPDEAVISAITLAELSVGPHVAHADEERAARQAHLQQAEADFDALAFDAESARAFGAVAASLRASGRKPAARPYDALIAAPHTTRIRGVTAQRHQCGELGQRPRWADSLEMQQAGPAVVR